MKRLLVAAMLGWVLGAAPAPDDKKLFPVDLQPQANRKLTDNQGSGTEGNHLKELPTGEQTFGGIRFKVGDGLIQLGSKLMDTMPDKVEGIQVGRRCAKLHILHATCFGGGPNVEGGPGFVPDETTIGEYRVNCEDKSSEAIPIVYGKDVRDWWHVPGEKDVSRGRVVWVGDNDFAKQVNARIRLYLTTWEN